MRLSKLRSERKPCKSVGAPPQAVRSRRWYQRYGGREVSTRDWRGDEWVHCPRSARQAD